MQQCDDLTLFLQGKQRCTVAGCKERKRARMVGLVEMVRHARVAHTKEPLFRSLRLHFGLAIGSK